MPEILLDMWLMFCEWRHQRARWREAKWGRRQFAAYDRLSKKLNPKVKRS